MNLRHASKATRLSGAAINWGMNTQPHGTRPVTDLQSVPAEPVAGTPPPVQQPLIPVLPLDTLTVPASPAQPARLKTNDSPDTTSERPTTLVPAKEPSITLKDMPIDVASLGQVALIAYGAWQFVRHRFNSLNFFRNAVRLHVEDLGVPERGPYYWTGNVPTDVKVKQLIRDQKSPDNKNPRDKNHPILISGPKEVGMFFIAKALAAELDRPLLKIDCGALANSHGKLPAGLVSFIAWRVAQASWRHGAREVVLVLDGLERLACAQQDEFINKLKQSLADPTSRLRSSALVVGISYSEREMACSSPQADLLAGLKKTFSSPLPATPPETAAERFDLLSCRIHGFITYQTSWSGHQFSHEDTTFLRAIAHSLPEVAINDTVTKLACAVTEASINAKQPISGDHFKNLVLDEALNAVMGPRLERISNAETTTRDARAVICEAFVARSLGATIMAIGVQARSDKSYVCRDRVDAQNQTLEDILKEAIALEARKLSYSYRQTSEHASIEGPQSEILELNTKLGKLIGAATEFIGASGGVATNRSPVEIKESVVNCIQDTVDTMLKILFSKSNLPAFTTLLNELAPKGSGQAPVELKNGALERYLNAFKFDRAEKVAKLLIRKSPKYFSQRPRGKNPSTV